MVLDEFTYEIKKLFSFYGRKSNDDMLYAWYLKMQDFDVRDLSYAVDAMTSEQAHLPTPSVVIAKMFESKRRRDFLNPHSQMNAKCVYCRSSGLVWAIKTESRYVFNCERCEISKAGYPKWNPEKFYPMGFRPMDDDALDTSDHEQARGCSLLRNSASKLFAEMLKTHPNAQVMADEYEEKNGPAQTQILDMNQVMGIDIDYNLNESIRAQSIAKAETELEDFM